MRKSVIAVAIPFRTFRARPAVGTDHPGQEDARREPQGDQQGDLESLHGYFTIPIGQRIARPTIAFPQLLALGLP
jgi:hypothetical protein